MKALVLVVLLSSAMCVCAEEAFEATRDLPVACKGRFCSLEASARLWLYDIYHKQELKQSDTSDTSALGLLWRLHFLGHTPWDNTPLFWIHYAQVKEMGGLPLNQDRFSYNDLIFLKEGLTGPAAAELTSLQEKLKLFAEGSSSSLKMLPLKKARGEWASLHALHKENNVTAFSDADFQRVRSAYLALKNAVVNDKDIAPATERFANAYSDAYAKLAGQQYKRAEGKALTYPTFARLHAETLYYRLPLIVAAIAAYGLALLLMIGNSRPRNILAMILLTAGFLLHTTVLAMRCFILQRPPVSNMFETVVYVPWISLILGIAYYAFTKSRIVLAAATAASLALLVLLQITQVDARMENVQAVLDSQYWLIIHVLMIVGSYGAFALCGVLAHIYLFQSMRKRPHNESMQKMSQGILHTMYVGVALLIPGTILGGVWAAESWGRFWDWDPKESWAFITACVYLLVIHAYTFLRIKDFGLAVGAIAGLMAMSFTWYGVNYVLGTGLHSYGFGSGGEKYYFGYLAIECAFLLIATAVNKKSEGTLHQLR